MIQMDDIAQVIGRLELDPLLLGPCHVMRAEQPLHLHGKLHTRTWIGREQLLANCDIHHTAKNPQFLMDCGRLEPVLFDDTACGSNLNSHLKPPVKIQLDVIDGDVSQRPLCERLFEMQAPAFVSFVGLFCPNRRLGVVLQKEIRPIREL